MKRWAARLDVICDSKETAVAYAQQLNQLMKSKFLPLPTGYLMAEISVQIGHFDRLIPADPAVEVTFRDGGEDA